MLYKDAARTVLDCDAAAADVMMLLLLLYADGDAAECDLMLVKMMIRRRMATCFPALVPRGGARNPSHDRNPCDDAADDCDLSCFASVSCLCRKSALLASFLVQSARSEPAASNQWASPVPGEGLYCHETAKTA